MGLHPFLKIYTQITVDKGKKKIFFSDVTTGKVPMFLLFLYLSLASQGLLLCLESLMNSQPVKRDLV